MVTAVDTNVLVEILGGGRRAEDAQVALAKCAARGSLAICGPVYGELLVGAPSGEALDQMLQRMRIGVDWRLDKDVWSACAEAWRSYLDNRRKQGNAYFCPSCGEVNQFSCKQCGQPATAPRHVLNDFLIGGHAAVYAGALLTWDRGIYKRYFPDLQVISPH